MRGTALVPLGVVVAPHGVRGELRVKLHNPASDLLAERREVMLREPGQVAPRRVAIVSTHVHREGLWLLRIAGCDDRDAAIALRGAEFCIARDELPALDDGQHYLVDFIGLEVREVGGKILGQVEDAIAYPASEVLRVKSKEGVWEIPLLEPYVVEVRIDAGFVIVDQLEDLEIEKPRGPSKD